VLEEKRENSLQLAEFSFYL